MFLIAVLILTARCNPNSVMFTAQNTVQYNRRRTQLYATRKCNKHRHVLPYVSMTLYASAMKFSKFHIKFCYCFEVTLYTPYQNNKTHGTSVPPT